jgi:hypothetical protein
MRTTRSLALLVGVVAALVMTAACRSGAPDSSTSSTSPGASSPASGLVYGGPEDEYLPLLAACLRDAGWDATTNERGDEMNVSGAGPGQRQAFEDAQAACERQIGVPPTPRPLTEAEIRARYDYLVQMRQCLIDLGYTLAEPPTIDVFIDTWATGPWSPYNEVSQVADRDQWAEANQKCPQVVFGQ